MRYHLKIWKYDVKSGQKYLKKLSLNAFTAMGDFIDFTLSNARRFYSSKGKNLAAKGLILGGLEPSMFYGKKTVKLNL